MNVGRSRRTTPDHTRRLVLDRDRVCRHPSCSVTRYLEVHHVDHWSQQRRGTDTGNLVALCPFHHDAHHRGAFGLVGNADDPAGLVFRDARGRPLPSGPRPVPPTGPPAPPPGHAYRHPSGERANWRWFDLPPAPVALAAPAPPALAAAPVSVGTTAPPAPVAPVGLAGSPSGRSRAPASERLPEQLTNS